MHPKLQNEYDSFRAEIVELIPPAQRQEADRRFEGFFGTLDRVDRAAFTHVETGLPNTSAMVERDELDKFMSPVKTSSIKTERREVVIPEVHGWWVEYIDLDHFKTINDTWLHAQGDRVLRYAANAITRSVRPAIDEVYHPHGDEFIIFAPALKAPVKGFNLKELIDQRMRKEIKTLLTTNGRELVPKGMRLTQKDRQSLEIIDWTIGEEFIKGPNVRRYMAERKADAKMQALKRYNRVST